MKFTFDFAEDTVDLLALAKKNEDHPQSETTGTKI